MMRIPNAGNQVTFGDGLPKVDGEIDKPVVVGEMKAAIVLLRQHARRRNGKIAL